MKPFKTLIAVATVAIAGFGLSAGMAMAQSEQFIPRLVYRTGPYAPNGIPFADGYADYLDMIDARDGGVGGVKITYEECETGYNNDKGVECYERLKNKGPTGASLVEPLSTGITYALIERATVDKIPVVSMGYGRADASDGAVFPYVFTLPATYWAQADARSSMSASKWAASTSSRARRSVSSISTSPTARSRSRSSKNCRRNTATPFTNSRSRRPGSSSRQPGCRSVSTGRTGC